MTFLFVCLFVVYLLFGGGDGGGGGGGTHGAWQDDGKFDLRNDKYGSKEWPSYALMSFQGKGSG